MPLIFLHHQMSCTVVVFMTFFLGGSLLCIHDPLSVMPPHAQVYVVVIISDEM